MTIVSTILSISHFALTIAAGLIGIGIIVGFHELGHFLFCKLFNIRTPSFSIGFGPKLISKKIWDTEFSLSAIPAGGYVEIAGSAEVGQGDQKEAFSTDENSFIRKPWYQKMLVMIGGIAFNIIFAYIVLTLVFLIGGSNSPLLLNFAKPSTHAIKIMPDSPAEKAGLTSDFYLRAIEFTENGQQITISAETPGKFLPEGDMSPLLTAIKEHPDTPAILHISRYNEPIPIGIPTGELLLEKTSIPVTLGSKEIDSVKIGTLGIEFERKPLKATSFLQAVKHGIQLTHEHIVLTYEGFVQIFSTRDTSGMGGPIMIISATGQAFSKGFTFFLLLLAIISINLAILNLIPLPIFDGGQMLYYTIEAITGKPIPTKIREYIHLANWLLVGSLFLYFGFKDTKRILQPQWKKVTKLFASKDKLSSSENK